MSKAVLELPDTIDPGEGADKVNVDDLLAQMAGDEIDRLLSEADDPRGVSPSHPPEPRGAAPASSPAAPPVVVDPTPPPIATAASVLPPAIATPESVSQTEEEVAGMLDDLLSGMTSEAESPTPAVHASSPIPVVEAPTPPVEPVALPEAGIVHPETISEVAAPNVGAGEDSETSNAERSALDSSLLGLDGAASEDEAAELDDQPLPWYLKPLEWINAPLDYLSDPVRELVGKLALLTLFNATAVLFYVLIFRRHHH